MVPHWNGPWWDEDCDKRGVGLKHHHGSTCLLDPNLCDHCQRFIRYRTPAMKELADEQAKKQEHTCSWNVSGFCHHCGAKVPTTATSNWIEDVGLDSIVAPWPDLSTVASSPEPSIPWRGTPREVRRALITRGVLPSEATRIVAYLAGLSPAVDWKLLELEKLEFLRWRSGKIER